MSIWKGQESEFDYQLYDEIDTFFEQLHKNPDLEYREAQHTMALDIMSAIKKKEILLIEAGVGSGKSWGYLVPLIYASQNKEKFKGFIVSTSSLALQEQLKKEVQKISDMLGIEVPVTIAKGRNNYLCQKRLDIQLKHSKNRARWLTLEEKVNRGGYIDRIDFREIDDNSWKLINVDNVNCKNCIYNQGIHTQCRYVLKRNSWRNANAIICNHDLLIESLKRDDSNKIFEDPSILIVDEAHSLEEKIRNNLQMTLTKNDIENLLYSIHFLVEEGNLQMFRESPVIESLNRVFRMISTKAKREFRNNSIRDVDVLDAKGSGFSCTPKMKEEIEQFVVQLIKLEEKAMNSSYCSQRAFDKIRELKKIHRVFLDMISPADKRKNIYWASFIPNTKDHIAIEYVSKDLRETSTRLFSNPNYAKVFTSATLTTEKDDYSYFMNGLGLNRINGISLTQEYSQESPYQYDKNALLYLAKDVISPKEKDHGIYLTSLTNKISELLETTGGRSLVLFTSKKDMEEVYKRLQEKEMYYPIYMQKSSKTSEKLKEKFKNEETSVLLATGSFWEGIDVKGSSLENVIITKLPFPIVSPIMEEKASYYQNGFQEVYFKEMLIRLKQGTGRLIRCATDKGIVSILDPRVMDYQDAILTALPFTKTTTNMERVEVFTKEILHHPPVK